MARLKFAPGRLAASDGGRVRVVRGETGSARQVKGGSSTARGYGYRWQKARAAFLAANPLCAMCSSTLSPVAAEVVDHIKPHRGDDALFWDEDNWQPLCKRCHSSVKQRMERGSGRGGSSRMG